MAIVDDDVASDEGLETAILLSLFTDRRANDNDELPVEGGDRRGWWADEFALVDGDLFGSRIWLLERSTRRDDVLPRAELYAREALQWLIDDRVLRTLDVTVTDIANGLNYAVSVTRPDGRRAEFNFEHLWEGQANAV